MISNPPVIQCEVASVADADTLRCANGTRVRIAGIEANERKGGCHLPVCPPLPAARAKPIAERLVLRKTLKCQPVGTSYRRTVARCTLPDGRSLSCALIASGAAVKWPSYWRRYNMGECR